MSVALTAAERDKPGCIHHWFEQRANKRPDDVAVTMGSEQLTYAELNTRANMLAHRLIMAGIGPNACAECDLAPGFRDRVGVDQLGTDIPVSLIPVLQIPRGYGFSAEDNFPQREVGMRMFECFV